ncbi:rab-GTPase-TBC domain-domain-containing protein [Absidia repens]|uniref:Rab-GTPase-TBC domain-domain-containing protein n=1 Tax=Absidia repens TaxID=90262 RepID=A0A1X2INF8_9FUNG|nr:rab-GTPase-TBC domain-domain-containing protein [Absidia repens]
MALFANDIDLKTRAVGQLTPTFAYCNFVASAASTESLAQSGHLALSAPSQIIGRFQSLKILRHPHLCSYVDIHRGKHDRLFVVSEYFGHSLQKAGECMDSSVPFDPTQYITIQNLAGELLEGITYLHDLGIVHGCLCPQLILLDSERHVKLFNYGLNYMTGNGVDVDFPIGYPGYLAPESIMNLDARRNSKQDIWSLGVILVEQYTRHSFWTTSDLGLIFHSLATLAKWARTSSANVWQHKDIETLDINETVLRFLQQKTETNGTHQEDYNGDTTSSKTSISEDDGTATDILHRFILDCLQVDPNQRLSGHSLLSSPFLSSWTDTTSISTQWIKGPALVSENLTEPDCDGGDDDTSKQSKQQQDGDLLQGLPISQVYNLWKLAGGDVELDAAKKGAFLVTPVIERLPRLCGLAEGAEIGMTSRDAAQLYSDAVFTLGFKELYQRLDEEQQRTNNGGQSDRFEWDTDYFMVVDENEVNFLLDQDEENASGDNIDMPLEDRFIFTDGTAANNDVNKINSNPPHEHSIASPISPQHNAPVSPPPSSRSGRRALSFTGLSRSNSASSLPPTSPTGNNTSNAFVSTPSGSHSSITHLATASLSINNNSNTATTSGGNKNSNKLPLFLREQDVNYQFRRQALFSALLQQYPASKKELIHHAKVDIPPLLRGKVWAAILGVHGNVNQQYSNINKCIDMGADRQIDVDVPRCHQYNQLLASSVGHNKLRRLLKAWVAANPDLVYWQGLDSLCAPFLTLHFNDEAMAFACLQLFIPRFLNNFFLSDNAPVLQEYLAVFRHLLSYHDPELSSHLDTIGFMPDLYAIPWFLTLFTHVFPLDKIYHLWDKLLVGPSSLPLFAGIAILRQIRDVLLSCEFNDCIVLISDSFPKVDIEKCVQNAMSMCKVTPPSVSARIHEDSQNDKIKPKTDGGERATANDIIKKKDDTSSISAIDDVNASRTDTSDGDFVVVSEGDEAWWEQPLSIDVKKKELAPRINVIDLQRVLPYCLVLDIRSEQAFTRGHIPSSMNVQEQQLPSYATVLKKLNRKYHVVMAENDHAGAEYAGQLVHRFFPRVATLQGGIHALEASKGSNQLCYCRPQKQTKPGFKGKEPPFIIWRCKVPPPLMNK